MSTPLPIRICKTAALAAVLLFSPGNLLAQAVHQDSDVAFRAEQLVRDGQVSQAQDLLQGFLLQHPASIPVLIALGDLALSRLGYSEALDHFETALRAAPNDEHARMSERTAAEAYALQQRASGDNRAALFTLQHASQILDGDLRLLTDLGIQAQFMRLPKTAHSAFARALQTDPNDSRAIYAIAGLETEEQEYTSAALHYRAYLKARPGDASAYYGLGRVYQLQQRDAEAIESYDQAIALQPVQTESYYQLGQIALQAHQDTDARERFLKVLSRMPTHGGALTGLGIVDYRAKQYSAAVQYLRSAVSTSPDYQLAYYYLGLALTRLNLPVEAQTPLRRAVELAAQQQGRGNPISPE